MSNESAEAFFDRLSTDEAFAEELAAVRTDPAAVQALISEAGFAVDPAEVRDVFLEQFGDQLTEEQLAAVAGGLSSDAANGIMVGSIAGAMVITGVAAGAAAAA